MSPRLKKLYTFPIDPELARALKALKEIEGTSEAELIREGIRCILTNRGYSRRAGESWGKAVDRLEKAVTRNREK